MRISIIVITFNRLPLTRICLESLLEHARVPCDIIVVDNASTDGTRDYLEALAARSGRITVRNLARNMGLSVAINQGMAEAEADYYVRMDNDIEVKEPGWLEAMTGIAENNAHVGLVGYQFCSWHETTRVVLPSGHAFRKAASCGGGCMLVPRKSFELCGFMNEDYGKYGFEDLDYSNRVLMDGGIVGYVDNDGALAHLGYERQVDPVMEERKGVNTRSALAGEKLYLLNKLLFEEGVRSRFVNRKYLPDGESPDGIRFRLDEAYKPIMKLHQQILPRCAYTLDGDQVKLDLSLLRGDAF